MVIPGSVPVASDGRVNTGTRRLLMENQRWLLTCGALVTGTCQASSQADSDTTSPYCVGAVPRQLPLSSDRAKDAIVVIFKALIRDDVPIDGQDVGPIQLYSPHVAQRMMVRA
jgi:hypothetical protein